MIVCYRADRGVGGILHSITRCTQSSMSFVPLTVIRFYHVLALLLPKEAHDVPLSLLRSSFT